MYEDHFSLDLKPFQITADPKFLWLGEKHKEALATLRYGIIDNRGFLLMTGEVGTGKTLLINRLLTLLDENTVVATLRDPGLEKLDFFNVLANAFDIKRTFETKGQFLIHFREFLLQSYKNRKQILLIIDESQRMDTKLMDDIRALSNIELQDRKLINIFFVGQQEFNNILMTTENRALSQRITVRYHIEALDEDETGDYIRHRLKVAGSDQKIFKKSAVKEVFNISGGLPRLINIICDRALLTAYTQGILRVDGTIILECAEELRIPVEKPKAEAASFKAAGQPSDGKTSDPKWDVNTSQLTVGEKADENRIYVHAADPHSFRWSRWLSNLTAIILILGVVAYFIDRYSGNSRQEVSNTPSTVHSDSSSEAVKIGGGKTEATAGGATTGDKPSANEAGKVKNQVPPSSDSEPAPAHARAQGQASEREKPETATETVNSKIFAQGKIIIPFSHSSNEIEAESYTLLYEVAVYMARYPEAAVNVSGFTDNRGIKSFNESMSLFRANVVKSYLVGKGVHPDRIAIYAKGNANPIASNESLAGRKKNRRVEIELNSN